MQETQYPVQFSVDYPDRDLNRLTTFFRIFVAIPILIVLAHRFGWRGVSVRGGSRADVRRRRPADCCSSAPLLMIVFRQKYPRWWFDWNLELSRFSARVGVYLALMNDQYPSTDEGQSVHLDFPYPDVPRDLNRWLPLVKWFLAIPHYIVLLFLFIAVFVTFSSPGSRSCSRAATRGASSTSRRAWDGGEPCDRVCVPAGDGQVPAVPAVALANAASLQPFRSRF